MPRPKRARRAPNPPQAAARSPSPALMENSSEKEDTRQPEASSRGQRRTRQSTDTRPKVVEETKIPTARTRGRGRAAAREEPADDAESGSSVEMSRRILATPAQRRDTTGLDLADEDVFGDLDDSFEDGDLPRGIQSTDTSTFLVGNYKQRSRQSSFIGRNDPPIRPSSRGGTTPSISAALNLGAFRRRAREPSILGTSRKPRPDETAVEDSAGSESEEDFLPEAESTPLNNRRRTTQSAVVAAEAGEGGDQDDDEVGSEPDVSTKVASTLSRSKKRKSEDVPVSPERPEKASRLDLSEGQEEDEDAGAEPAAGSDSESNLSSLSSPVGPPAGLPARYATPENLEEIMAPPASSGSEDADDVWPNIHTLAKRRRRPSVRTPTRADILSDLSSPPSLTHSPNYNTAKAPAPAKGRQTTTRRQPSPKMTTADLTNLLPKRRYKKTQDTSDLDSDEELDNSGLAEDEDELSYLDTRGSRRKRGGRPPAGGASARPGSRGGRAPPSVPKPRQASASGKAAARASRTYSRRSSDKENEGEERGGENDNEDDASRFHPLPDEVFESIESERRSTPSADELRQAAKKFKEVDKWELEFEEITQSSSPSNAR